MFYRMKSFLLIGIMCLTLIILAFSCVILLREDFYDWDNTPALEYDYEDLQMQITIAPFDTLKPPEYDAEALIKENPDFRDWLHIPDTSISFPVVQGTDNAYYLKHSFQKQRSAYGCPFLEYKTTASDRNLVIHGHNMGMNREEMFSPLVRFQDQTYADRHFTIFYSDPNQPGEERYTLFAVLNLSVKNTDEFQYRQQQFSDEDAFRQYVSYLKEHSIYESDYTPTGELLILSTCNRAYGNDNRLLICAGREG